LLARSALRYSSSYSFVICCYVVFFLFVFLNCSICRSRKPFFLDGKLKSFSLLENSCEPGTGATRRCAYRIESKGLITWSGRRLNDSVLLLHLKDLRLFNSALSGKSKNLSFSISACSIVPLLVGILSTNGILPRSSSPTPFDPIPLPSFLISSTKNWFYSSILELDTKLDVLLSRSYSSVIPSNLSLI